MTPTNRGKWDRVQVAGHDCDIYEPAQMGPYAIMFLHGLGQETLVANERWTELFESYGLRAISPHGKRSWWTNRICAEFDAQVTAERYIIQSVLPFIDARWGIVAPRLGLVGISMGGQGALRLALRFPAKFPVVAAISSAIDYQNLYGQESTIDEMYIDKESVRQDTVPLHVHPLNWPRNMLFVIDPSDRFWIDGNQRFHEKLAALGIPHEYDFSTSAGGHGWQYFDHMAPRVLEFVKRGLDAESLRAGAL